MVLMMPLALWDWPLLYGRLRLPIVNGCRGRCRESSKTLARPLSVADELPDPIRRRRHLYVAHAEIPQRIHDSADDDGRRRRGAALATGLDAERIGRRQHLGDPGRE